MKRIIVFTGLLLLTGCTHLFNQPQSEQPTESDEPSHLVKLLDDEEMTTYLSVQPVSLYNDRVHIRQFYIVNNFKEELVIDNESHLVAHSSRAINVIHCQRAQRAVLDRTYFSGRYATGDVVLKEKYEAKWTSYAPDSILNTVHGFVCNIDPSELEPVPEED